MDRTGYDDFAVLIDRRVPGKAVSRDVLTRQCRLLREYQAQLGSAIARRPAKFLLANNSTVYDQK